MGCFVLIVARPASTTENIACPSIMTRLKVGKTKHPIVYSLIIIVYPNVYRVSHIRIGCPKSLSGVTGVYRISKGYTPYNSAAAFKMINGDNAFGLFRVWGAFM